MNLIILKKDIPDNQFIDFLIPYIKEEILSHKDINQLIPVKNFISDNAEEFDNKDFYWFIDSAVNNIGYSEYFDKFIISIKNTLEKVTDMVTVGDVYRLINFGNLSVVGYPIFTTSFAYFVRNLDKYINLYMINSGVYY